jgi:hypothetical protein
VGKRNQHIGSRREFEFGKLTSFAKPNIGDNIPFQTGSRKSLSKTIIGGNDTRMTTTTNVIMVKMQDLRHTRERQQPTTINVPKRLQRDHRDYEDNLREKTRQGNGIHHRSTTTVNKSQVNRTQEKLPTGETTFWILHLKKRSDGFVIGEYLEVSTIKISTKVFHTFNDSQSFLLGESVIELMPVKGI